MSATAWIAVATASFLGTAFGYFLGWRLTSWKAKDMEIDLNLLQTENLVLRRHLEKRK